MAELELPPIEQAVVVRPGDVLILRLGADVSPEQLQRFREIAETKLHELLPGVEVVYLAGSVEQIAAFRLDGLPEAGSV